MIPDVQTHTDNLMRMRFGLAILPLKLDAHKLEFGTQRESALPCVYSWKPAYTVVAAIVGDITPCDGVSKEDKNRLETEAMHKIRHVLGSNTIAGDCPDLTFFCIVLRAFNLP